MTKNVVSKNYRVYLKQIIETKKKTNPQFSIRAMSLHLGLSHSALGLIINGKKNLSPEMAMKIARKLKLSKQERDYFCAMVQLETTKDAELKADLRIKIRDLRPYPPITKSEAAFQWYDFAILAATEVADTAFTAEHFSKRLGVPLADIQAGIDRLKARKYLGQGPDGQWEQLVPRILEEGPRESLIERFRLLYRRAEASITEQPFDQRLHMTETFAFSPALIGEALIATEEYSARILALASDSREEGKLMTDVYSLVIGLYNLTPYKG
jgi:uncharacterized protein (TIGR02147 family)